jgi:hypothetical protein
LLEYRETAFEENNLVAHGKEASVVAMWLRKSSWGKPNLEPLLGYV